MATKEERRLVWLRREERRKAAKSAAHQEAFLARALALNELGFLTYSEYLNSPLWGRIRAAVLGGNAVCWICIKRRATQVHHQSYAVAVLRGDNLSELVPLCHKCHRRVEFSHGNKRTHQAAVEHCGKLLARVGKRRAKMRFRRNPTSLTCFPAATVHNRGDE